jgi:hypothetical protein
VHPNKPYAASSAFLFWVVEYPVREFKGISWCMHDTQAGRGCPPWEKGIYYPGLERDGGDALSAIDSRSSDALLALEG